MSLRKQLQQVKDWYQQVENSADRMLYWIAALSYSAAAVAFLILFLFYLILFK